MCWSQYCCLRGSAGRGIAGPSKSGPSVSCRTRCLHRTLTNNWLFVGSATGGQTAAVLFTFTSTCRRLNLDPFAYLRDVLACLAAGPLSAEELALLLPQRWTPPTSDGLRP